MGPFHEHREWKWKHWTSNPKILQVQVGPPFFSVRCSLSTDCDSRHGTQMAHSCALFVSPRLNFKERQMKGIQRRKNKDGSTSYRVQIRVNKKYHSATFKRKRDALRYKQRLESDILRGRYFPEREAKERTVSELIDRYVQEIFPHRKSKATPLQTLNWWKTQIRQLKLGRLTTALITAFVLSIHNTKHSSKRFHILSVLEQSGVTVLNQYSFLMFTVIAFQRTSNTWICTQHSVQSLMPISLQY